MRPLTHPAARPQHAGLEEELSVDAERSRHRAAQQRRGPSRWARGRGLLDQHHSTRRQRPDRRGRRACREACRRGPRRGVRPRGSRPRRGTQRGLRTRSSTPHGIQVGIAEHERRAGPRSRTAAAYVAPIRPHPHHDDLHLPRLGRSPDVPPRGAPPRRIPLEVRRWRRLRITPPDEDARRMASGTSRSALRPIRPSRGAKPPPGRPGRPDRSRDAQSDAYHIAAEEGGRAQRRIRRIGLQRSAKREFASAFFWSRANTPRPRGAMADPHEFSGVVDQPRPRAALHAPSGSPDRRRRCTRHQISRRSWIPVAGTQHRRSGRMAGPGGGRCAQRAVRARLVASTSRSARQASMDPAARPTR